MEKNSLWISSSLTIVLSLHTVVQRKTIFFQRLPLYSSTSLCVFCAQTVAHPYGCSVRRFVQGNGLRGVLELSILPKYERKLGWMGDCEKKYQCTNIRLI